MRNVVDPCPPILEETCTVQTAKKTYTGITVAMDTFYEYIPEHERGCIGTWFFERKTRGRLLYLAKCFGPKRALFSCKRRYKAHHAR